MFFSMSTALLTKIARFGTIVIFWCLYSCEFYNSMKVEEIAISFRSPLGSDSNAVRPKCIARRGPILLLAIGIFGWHAPDSTVAVALAMGNAARSKSPPFTRSSTSRLTSLLASTTKKNEDDAVAAPNEAPGASEMEIPRGGGNADAASVSTDLRIGSTTQPLPPIPTIRQYIQFALPCLALWVAGPLLSLVDTSFIGLSPSSRGMSSAQQLAALGPATTLYVFHLYKNESFALVSSFCLLMLHCIFHLVLAGSFDGATYLFAFLNVATTNLYSSARAAANKDPTRAESVVRTSAQVAVNCGIGLMLFMFLFTRPLLQLYIGDKAAATPGLLDAATDYVLIRAISLPTSLLLGVLQAALLGAKDSVTPLVAIMYSTIVNVIGDFTLCRVFPLGLAGAAIATTLAQWAGTAALIPAARDKLVRDRNLGLWKRNGKQSSAQKASSNRNDNNTVSAKSFLGFAVPVLTLILGKLAAFGFMTHAAAHVPNQPTPLATHQIILSLLFFCCPFFEVISQTAQTFLPPFLAPMKDYIAQRTKKDPTYEASGDATLEPWNNAGQKVATSLLGIGLSAAGAVASIATLIPAYFGHFITTDHTVQMALKPLAKYLWMGAFFWAPVAVSEGVLLARLELKFLAGIYLLSTALLPPALVQIKLRPNGTVAQVWMCFVVFQICRATAFTSRIWGGFAMQRFFGRKPMNAPSTKKPSTPPIVQ
jgi:Na+-driven multidrug efflux pump